MTTYVEWHGLKEITKAFEQFPKETQAAAELTMEASLLVLWENVPAYPQPPQNSTYRRTGTLGKSLGSAMGGGKSSGEPSVYNVTGLGAGVEGRFGTSLEYAQYVIGDGTQAAIHAGRWWTLKQVASKSTARILHLWDTMADKLAMWLDRQGA